MKQLKNLNYTYLMIARSNHISVTQVQLYFDSFINIPRITLPVSLGIDEIHSKMAKRKDASYLAVLVDNLNRSLVDILPSRSKTELSRYFERIPLDERKQVRYVTIDMWPPYKEVCEKSLPNCIIAVDPFHVVRHLMEGFSRIRLNILNQCEYDSTTYYLLKTWKDLIEKDVFLDNEPIYEAFLSSGIHEFDGFITTISNWKKEILNSFQRPYDDRKLSNALSENINGQLQTYITISKGISNFMRFRKRVIFSLNPKVYYAITETLHSDKRQGKPRISHKKQNS